MRECLGTVVETVDVHGAHAARPPIDAGAQDGRRAMKPNIDQRPGRAPLVATRGGEITFTLTPAGIPRGVQLIIRCDTKGGVWLSIAPSETESTDK